MAARFGVKLNIRTQQSDEFLYDGSQIGHIENSIDSTSFLDESFSQQFQKIHQMQQISVVKEWNSISSRSQSYILVQEEENVEKTKSKSMKTSNKAHVSWMTIPNVRLKLLLSPHRCLNLAKNDLLNRAYGAMFGFAIGDSIGAYIINKPYNEAEIVEALMMKGGGIMNLKSGEGTDEWQICLSLSEGLIKCKGVYNHNIIAQKYLEWLESNPFDLPVLMGISFSDIRKCGRETGEIDLSTIGQQLIKGSLRNSKQQSVLGLVRIIPLVIWCLQLEQYQFNHIIKQQMKLIAPNQLVLETVLVYANILKTILTTGDHQLAYHEASYYVHSFGSQKMIEIWSCIEENRQPVMTNLTANNLKFPFIYAINELLELNGNHKSESTKFIQAAVRILSKGFNTDTNCSVALGLIGAVIGYNQIPSYFRSKIINSECSIASKHRTRDYSCRKVVEVVNELVNHGSHHLKRQLF